MTRCLGGIAATAVWFVACAPTTPVPKTGPHRESDQLVDVRTLPPEPVRVEIIGDPPSPDAVWVDGHWHWSGRRWVWKPGLWALAPKGAYYALPTVVRIPVAVYETDGDDNRRVLGYKGRLMYLSGHWHLEDGSVAPVEPLRKSDTK